MAWTTPPSFASSAVPTAAQLNTYVSDLTHLHTPVTNSYVETGSNITTTSTAFANISANFSKTFTMSGGNVLCLFSAVAGNVALDWNVDGTRRGDTTLGSAHWRTGTDFCIITIPLLLTGLSAGSHTISVQWRVPVAGTATIYTSYATRFYVMQLRGG